MSPASVRSIRSSTEARSPLANTVTKTTSARPIISAAEVTAVRPGWRVEFSRASRPTSLVERSIGAATIRAAGPTKRGEISAMPRIRITAPPAAPISLVEVSPPSASRPATTSPPPSRMRSAGEPRGQARPAPVRGRGRLAQRLHRGDARRPQRRGERARQRDERADQQADDDRAALEHEARGRQVDAERLEELVDALREAEPGDDADDRADEADRERLEQHRVQHLAARGAERAQQRQLARALRDGDRERVEDQERADQDRDEREREQAGGEEGEALADVVAELVGLLRGRAHLRGRRQQRGDAALQLGLRDAVAPGDVREVDLARLAEQRSGRSGDRRRRRSPRRARSTGRSWRGRRA